MHTYILTYIHIHIHRYIYTGLDSIKRYILRHQDSPVLTYIPSYSHTYIHTFIDTYTQVWTALSDIY